MDVGQAIRTLRLKHGLTQAQLAGMCDMSTNAICSLETGKSYPPQATVSKLCEVFAISQALFMMSAVEEGDFPEDKRVLYRAMLEPLRNELLEHRTPDGNHQKK